MDETSEYKRIRAIRSAEGHKKAIKEIRDAYGRFASAGICGSRKPIEPGMDFNSIRRTRGKATLNAIVEGSMKGYSEENVIELFNAAIGGSALTLDDVAAVIFDYKGLRFPEKTVGFVTYEPIKGFSKPSATEAYSIGNRIFTKVEEKKLSYRDIAGVFRSLLREAGAESTSRERKDALYGVVSDEFQDIGFIEKVKKVIVDYKDKQKDLEMFLYILLKD